MEGQGKADSGLSATFTNRDTITGMKKLEDLEKEVSALSPEELADFRAWFLEYDGAAWDQQIASDAKSGKLDSLAREAKAQYDSGKSSEV